MRFVLRGGTTLLILLLLFSGGFWLVQASQAKQAGRDYAVRELPGDLVVFVRDLAGSREEEPLPEEVIALRRQPGPTTDLPEPEPTPPEVVEPEKPKPPLPPPGPDRTARGLTRYEAGNFRGAASDWQLALDTNWSRELQENLWRARLYAAVVDRFPAPLFGPQDEIVVARVRSGATFQGRQIAESDEGIRLRTADGSVVHLASSDIIEKRIAKPETRGEVFADEYAERLRTSATASAYLELAEWSAVRGLVDRLGHLLDRCREAERTDGSVLAPYLAEGFADLSTDDQREVAAVLERLYASHPVTRQVTFAKLGVTQDEPQPVGERPEPAPAGTIDDDFFERLERAKDLARRGEAEYRKAQPGMVDRAKHRERGLELLTQAKDLFEELVDDRPGTRWLERYLQNVYIMHRWLRKDTPIK